MPEKTYRLLIILLLAGLVVINGIAAFSPAKPVQPECQQALDEALALTQKTSSQLSTMSSAYEDAVYDRAENINQQTFLALETQFSLSQLALRYSSAMLDIEAKCR